MSNYDSTKDTLLHIKHAKKLQLIIIKTAKDLKFLPE
jgi:hypothetical protein